MFTTKDNANSEIKFYTGAKFQAYDYVDFYAQVDGSFDSIGFVYGKDPYLRRNSSYSEKIEKFQENHQYGIYLVPKRQRWFWRKSVHLPLRMFLHPRQRPVSCYYWVGTLRR